MNKLFLLLALMIQGLIAQAQSNYILIAQKEAHQKIFVRNERVKVFFNFEGFKVNFTGRLDAVNKDTILVRGLRKRNSDHIAMIAVKDIKKIKQVYTGSRTTTGIIGMFGAIAGATILADALSNEAIFFADASIAMGIGAIVAGQIPYFLVTLAEKSYSTKHKYEFRTSDTNKKAAAEN
ncbi:MAG: hypothetical protein FD183_1603 [Chitinophagaceae bacterium]|nr:MAG: hypothetical protein FD183_1603 [Chitinophagaceae bacterium]